MWTLLVSRLNDPPGAFFDRRQVDAGLVKVGRSEKSCDLVLPDDQGFVSREHCTIVASGLDLFVTDTSKNGVALNDPAARIVPGQAVAIRPGDRLVVGDFVISVATPAEAAGLALSPPPPRPLPSSPSTGAMGDDPWFGAPDDPFLGAIGADETHDFLRGGGGFPSVPPADFGGTGAHPSDFGFADPLGEAFSRPLMAEPAPFDGGFAIPEDWANPGNGVGSGMAPLPTPPPFAASESAPPAGWEQFFEGAGLTPEELPLPPDAMYRLGVMYRQVVLGLCDILQDRAAFKDEFRVERTQLGIGRNNPLKHLPAIDAAKVVLGRELPGFMSGEDAIRTSFEDIKKHQLAMLAGVQRALIVAFQRLSPEEIEKFAEKADSRKKGLLRRGVDRWSMYVTVYEALRRDGTANANGVMSAAFREGYEQFMQSMP